jgi:predicted metal-dependent hydrolase
VSNTVSKLVTGLDLIRRGEFFAAHEELEDAWRAAEPAERDFFQGLVHVAVAWYQAGRGNRVGCERQLEKAARRLGPYAPEHRGVDIASVLQQVEAASKLVAGGSLELPLGYFSPYPSARSSPRCVNQISASFVARLLSASTPAKPRTTGST